MGRVKGTVMTQNLGFYLSTVQNLVEGFRNPRANSSLKMKLQNLYGTVNASVRMSVAL